MKHPLATISLLGIITLFACSETPEDESELFANTSPDSVSSHDSLQQLLEVDSAEVRAFVMPTPMQVPTVLSLAKANYQPELLAPTDSVNLYRETSSQARLLGLYISDIGYAGLNGDEQGTSDALDQVLRLATDLGLSSSFDAELLDRFEANQDNPDSLSYLILTGYDQAHSYFQESEQEELGLLVISGSMIEGLHLAISNKDLLQNREIYTLLVQQKTYLRNVALVLGSYSSNPDIKAVSEQLNQLLASVDELPDQARFDYERQPIIPENYDQIVADLQMKVAALRNEIIN